MEKKFSMACERNKQAILEILLHYLSPGQKVLEIGAGTGQHAAYFAANLPAVTWQSSDRSMNLASIELYRLEAGLDNLLPTKIIDIQLTSQLEPSDWIFTANTLHIMSWETVKRLIKLATQACSHAFIYGPFIFSDQELAASNRSFDQQLQAADSVMGLRQYDLIVEEFKTYDFLPKMVHPMPANNHVLIFERRMD
jgi:hypothetical protein